MTRLGWTLAERHIAKQFSVSRSRVRLLNDFEAAGYGVLTIAPSNSVLIKKGSHTKGIKAILGPGTGLGEAFVVPGKKHLVLPTEGGHSDFAPRTQEQWKLAQHIHRDVRSWEGVLSGSGLEHIYHFVSQGRKLTASEIAEQVPSNKDCEKAVRLFWDLLAQEAQNVALRTKSLGGVFISGGVARKLRRFLNRKRFETIFVDNTRMRYLLEQIPVHLVTSDSLELAGCLSIANTFQ